MKTVAIGILVAMAMHIFGTVPLIRACGGELRNWQILLADVVVGVAAAVLLS